MALSINRLCIIGVGLIGGSLARALREDGSVGSIVGCGRGRPNLEAAVRLGVIDEFTHEPAAAVDGADMVVVATNLAATPRIFEAIAGTLADDAVVTDVGSAKRRVVDAAYELLGQRFSNFVPGHPIAGTEHSGVEASFATLFRDHRVILTPLEATERSALEKVREMWMKTGATVVDLDVDRHDEILAATSHLPHLLAYALVDCLAGLNEPEQVFEFAAGGFRDFSRIASSNPEMWRDIVLDNRQALLDVLDQFDRTFAQMRKALQTDDSAALLDLFTRAKRVRDQLVLPDHQ